MNLAEWQTAYRNAQHERARIETALRGIEHAKADLFRQGVEASSVHTQRMLARRIRDLDGQAENLGRLLTLIHKQQLVLAHLHYARENADPLASGRLGQIQWATLLQLAQSTAFKRDVLLAQLDNALALFGATQTQPPKPQSAAPKLFLVTHVPDGDGLGLADGRRVRYIGIDAPEMNGRGVSPEPYAEQARAFNHELVCGKRVRLERDVSEADRYGRLLRYVYVGDVCVNAGMLRAGWARTLALAPDGARAEEFARIENEARQAKRGMWKRKSL